MDFLNFLMVPLGQFLYFIYETIAFKNYGWTIIIFTIIVKLAMTPLTYKQQKSSLEMQKIQPMLKEINENYKNDKEKLSAETMALYKEHNVNPMGSCLPMLIQLPILLALFQVISRPLSYLISISNESINKISDIMKAASVNLTSYPEVGIIKNIFNYVDKVNTDIGAGIGTKINELQNGMNFFGLKLFEVPKYNLYEKIWWDEWKVYLPLFVLCILGTIITFISSKLSMASMNKRNEHHNPAVIDVPNKKKKVNNSSNKEPEKNSQMAMTNNMMLYIGPIMTLFIAFQVPAGVTLYWTVGYIIMIIQQLIINKMFFSKKGGTKANV